MTRTLRVLPWLLLPVGLGLVLWGASADARDDQEQDAKGGQAGVAPGSRAARLTAGWPDRPREVASQMIAKYGMPDEITSSTLIWRDRGAWKRIAVHRELVRHDFPALHFDVLEQVIDYRVPPDRFDDLARFDGSLIARRTRGELAAMCDREALNILALNLAEDVIRGEKQVDAARAELARTAMAALRGEGSPMTQRLMLDASRVGTADPDTELRAPSATPPATTPGETTPEVDVPDLPAPSPRTPGIGEPAQPDPGTETKPEADDGPIEDL